MRDAKGVKEQLNEGCDLLGTAKWCTRDAVVRVSRRSVRVRARLLERVEVELSCGHLMCWRPLCLELSSVAGVSLPAPLPHPHQPYVCLSAAAAVSSRSCVCKALFSLALSRKLRKDARFEGFCVLYK